MIKSKIVTAGLLSSVLCYSALNASNKEEESIIRTACIYHFSQNLNEEGTDFFSTNNILDNQVLENELSNIAPLHINLIDRKVGDSVLEQLIPYKHLIYGLSLADNYFTNGALEILEKFKELRYLDVANNSFSYPSLNPLLTLSHLCTVDLTYNKIDIEEVRSLQTQRPILEVISSIQAK